VQLASTALTVDYERAFGRIPLAYERVLHDALAGDRSQFAREDAVEEAWRIVTPILDVPDQPVGYELGSLGPPSDSVLDEGHSWIDPPAAKPAD
jgi:glucose-6-phosphate 1-dehydrogenase